MSKKKKILVKPNQTPWDISLQEHGSIEAVFDVLTKNPQLSGLNDELDTGEELDVDSQLVIDANVKALAQTDEDPIGTRVGEIDTGGVCLPVDVTVDGDALEPTPSGESKAILIYDQFGNPIDRTIEDDLTNSVNILIQTPRIYIRPPLSGQEVVAKDYDDYWRVLNGVDTYVPPKIGMPMTRSKTNPWLLSTGLTNEYGNNYIYTGLTGGYYNPITETYHKVDDSETTRYGAFPDSVIRCNVTNMLIFDGVAPVDIWANLVDYCWGISPTGRQWFLPNVMEMAVHFKYDGGTYNGTSDDPFYNPPLNVGRANVKLTSTTYVLNPAQCWVTAASNTLQVDSKTRASYFSCVPMSYY